ncbi:amidohydrolase [Iodidimonas gelatinilytica]|uniref:Amidohydrolase n=3 Tax=Iodidimonas gelatinilytica TaxID=1236966 RepID=A0A5A7MYJ3_9PROT|nr:carbon-nitrogen hydrolase family protein [Iodidimonas gelatinilytica]GER01053.1 amidohydrolase [Iodidimonas gelatinilytica]
MARPLTLGLVQLTSSLDVTHNVAITSDLVRKAASDGAQLILTPEMTSCLDRDRDRALETACLEQDDPALPQFQALAHDLGITLLIGSLPIRLPLEETEGDAPKLANRSFLIGPDGAIMARYDKIHLFDVSLGNGEGYCESASYQSGDRAIVADMGAARLGLSICYDVRFAALYRALAQEGAEILTVPAAFTRTTGKAHWHVLLRARAIETGSFVAAPAQSGRHEDGRETFGHSLLISPWGEILMDGATDVGVSVARIDLDDVAKARLKIPALRHDKAISIKHS